MTCIIRKASRQTSDNSGPFRIDSARPVVLARNQADASSVESPHYNALQSRIAGADRAVDGVSTDDRRRSERILAPMPGWVSGESHDRSARGRDVSVVDLSEHGVGFCDRRGGYRVGAAHWLVVNGTTRISTRVKIVSCRRNDNGSFDVGAMFF